MGSVAVRCYGLSHCSLYNSAESEDILKRRMVAVGVVAAAATPLVVGAALGAAGFTAAGVAAGSWAAGWQAAQGSIAAGSWFAAVQSAGAATLGGFGAGTGVAATGVGYMTSACCGLSLSSMLFLVPALVLPYALSM